MTWRVGWMVSFTKANTVMSDFFRKNRAHVQEFLYDVEYITPLEDNIYEIIEPKARTENNDLQTVTISDIPCDEFYPISWIIDTETKEDALENVALKKPEKALILFTTDTVWVLMFELKTSIHLFRTKKKKNLEDISGIIKKFEDGLQQILLRLPLFDFDNSPNIEHIKFVAVTCFNQELVSKQLSENPRPDYSKYAKLFNLKTPKTIPVNVLEQSIELTFYWIQNPDFAVSPSEFELSLSKIIPIEELSNAQSTNLKCPREYV